MHSPECEGTSSVISVLLSEQLESDIMLLTAVVFNWSCVFSGVLADSSHPSEPGVVWELGAVGETGRCFSGRPSIWLPEDWTEAGLHLHHTFGYTYNSLSHSHTHTICWWFQWCDRNRIFMCVLLRLDSCCLHPCGLNGVWRKLPAQLQHPHAT